MLVSIFLLLGNMMKQIESQLILQLNHMLNTRDTGLTVKGLIRVKGELTRCYMLCNQHGYGDDWGTKWQPKIVDLSSTGCPKCAMCYRYTESESKEIVQKVLDKSHPHLTIRGFLNYIGKESRCIITCTKHGEGDKWANPWHPNMGVILRGFGCPKCSKTYRYTENERLVLLNEKLKNNLWSVLKIDGTGNKARCEMYCEKHKLTSKWLNPWRPTVNDIDSGYGCPKCKNSYRKTPIEALTQLNRKLVNCGFLHRVTSFVDSYNGKNSTCHIHCEKHGDANEWENPWQPRLHDLNMKRINCLKCSGEYNLGEIEVKDAINNFIATKKIRVNGFERFFINEKVNSSRCIMQCVIHGCGDNHTPHWRPTLGDLKAGTGCPLCGFEGRMLKHCLKHTELFSLPRYLYYLTLKVEVTGKRFYKIGVRTKPLLSSRYSFVQLKNSGLSLESEWIQCYPNIISLLVEYWLLHTNARLLQYQPLMKRRGLEGATECFNVDISANISMGQLVRSALDNIPNILAFILSSDTQITTALKHIKPLKEQVIASLETRSE